MSLSRSCLRGVILLAALAAPVANACTVSSGALSFGIIDPLAGTQRDSTANLTVACPALTSYVVALGAGSGTFNQRTLVAGGRLLNYNLYIDAQRTQIWGDGSGNTWTVNGSADPSGTVHTIYGSIPPQPRAAPGIYSDTIVITVTY